MDILKNKLYSSYNYINRYNDVPYYYNSVDDKLMSGIGSNIFKNVAYITHQLKETDTLDYLALKYYNDPTLWWIIAYFNDIQDAFETLWHFRRTVRIPNISGIEFGAER